MGFSGGSANFYSYVNINPILNSDAYGLEPAGLNHQYPLYLGGNPAQPLIYLTKDQHTRFHDYFRNKGFGYGRNKTIQSCSKWAKLTERQRKRMLMRAMRYAGIGNRIIQNNIDDIMKGSIPGQNLSKLRSTARGRVIPVAGLIGGVALDILMNPGVVQAAEVSNDWRDPSMSMILGPRMEATQSADYSQIVVVPNSWNIFGEQIVYPATIVSPWVNYREMTSSEAKSLEGSIGMRVITQDIGYTVYEYTFSKVRWAGIDRGIPTGAAKNNSRTCKD